MSDSRELASKDFGIGMKWLVAILAALTLAFCGVVAPLDSDAQTAYAEDSILYDDDYPAYIGDAPGYYKDGSYFDGYWTCFYPLYFDDEISGEVGLDLGKGMQLKSRVQNTTVKTLVWKSSKPTVVAVNKKGYIKAKKPGKAKITVTNKYRTSDYDTLIVEVYKAPTKSKVYKKLMKLKKKFPEGKQWGSEKYYFWKKANMHSYECAAFGAKVSDLLFGKNKRIKIHHSFKKMRIGDYVRIGGSHSIIVVTKGKNWIRVAEGNYGGKVHWNRKITKSELSSAGFEVWTRY